MVSKPTPSYRLSSTPQSASRLIESSVELWLASWRQTLCYSLLYGFAGLLPMLTLGDLASSMLNSSISFALGSLVPWLPLDADDPIEILGAAMSWLSSPQTWMLFGAALLLALVSITALIYRQQRIAIGEDAHLPQCTRAALARAPAAIGAWIGYGAILLLLTAPLVMLTVCVYLFAPGLELDVVGVLLLFALYLLAAILLSIPLVWGSVAIGWAPFVSTIEKCGPLEAQRRSVRLVRGHWTHAAVVVSVPMLLYLGIGSAVSSLALIVSAGLAYGLGGWPALMSGSWLLWSQLASAIPMAMTLPLAFAGGVVGLHDLTLRRQTFPPAAWRGSEQEQNPGPSLGRR